jgi:hypothetical protein
LAAKIIFHSFVYGSNGVAVQYQNWYYGEPNNFNGTGFGGEDCVLMYGHPEYMSWVDTACNDNWIYTVCEKTEDDVAPWPTSVLT